MYEKANIVFDLPARKKWLEEGDHGSRCQICHRPWDNPGFGGFEVHHIIHGSNGRSDEPCNFLCVCRRCHDMIHNGGCRDGRTNEPLPDITLGNVLWVKSHTDEWDEDRLKQLYHRALPSWDILPPYYLAKRTQYRRVA